MANQENDIDHESEEELIDIAQLYQLTFKDHRLEHAER